VGRVVFAIAFIAAIVSGDIGLRAEDKTIGGELNWPQTPIIDETPLQPQQPRPRAAPAERQQSAPSGAGQSQAAPADAAQRATSSTRATRNPTAQRRPLRPWNGEARLQRRPAARETASRAEEDVSAPEPPVPDRREATAPVLPQSVPVALNLAHTIPAAEQDPALGKIIGQMLIVGFQGATPDESWPRQVAAQIESGKIGGVLVMKHNIQAPPQLAKLTAVFRRTKAPIAPFIAIDQEGGLAPQLPPDKGFQQYASAAALGMSNDPLNAYSVYQRMAIELSVNGFNVNLGPVVDLDQTGENGTPTANEQRYGTQPKHVAAFAKAFRLAHHNEGLLTVLKHFPGPISANPEAGGAAEPGARWDVAALEPYRQLVEGGNADMVMVGHISDAEFSDEPGLPASLSEKAIQTRLRQQIGFKGLIMSDDLEAKAVAARFPLEESVVRAIRAGNDLLLIRNQDNPAPDLPERVAAIIKQAVTAGALTRERLQASYDRIIAAKQSLSQAAREIASAKQTDLDDNKPAAP
jgi:beta-N-acetylhexosaminidase